MSIDVIWTMAASVGEKTLGLYKVEGARLTICFAAIGKDRPKEFSSEPGSGNELVTYGRAKITERKKER
jgi:hypothetical protein